MPQCVFCDATDNLNTQMNVTIDDGTKVTVFICDTHAEDATVKTAKNAYTIKQDKIKVLIEQAKALGFNLTGMEQQGGVLVPTLAKPPRPAAPAAEASPAQPEALEGDQVISTEILDSRRGMQSVGGQLDGVGHVTSHSSHDLSGLQSKLPEDARKGKAKMAIVEARVGMPIAIPETRIDGLGTTRIRVTKKENDGTLQSRFKKMAKDSIELDRTPDFARSGYQNTQAECPICRGTCVIKQNVGGVVKEVSCPKCGGLGSISTV